MMTRIWNGIATGCLGLLLLFSSGCASGMPSLVKVSPDSQRVVYEDCRYARVYVHDLPTGRKQVFAGSLVYMDDTLEHLILVPQHHVTGRSIKPAIIKMSEGTAHRRELPPIQPGFLVLDLYLNWDRDSGEATACAYGVRSGRPAPDAKAYLRWRPGEAVWTSLPFPDRPFAERNDYSHKGPRGARDAGPVYCPLDIPPVGSQATDSAPATRPEDFLEAMEKEELARSGIGLSRKVTWKGLFHGDPQITTMLSSPDGKYLIRIGDGDDPWQRLTVTDVATGKRRILLNKNDLANEILMIPSALAFGLFLLVTGTRI